MFKIEIGRYSLFDVLCDKQNFTCHDLYVLKRILKIMLFLSEEVVKYFKTIQLKLSIQELKSVLFPKYSILSPVFLSQKHEIQNGYTVFIS